MSNMGEDGQEVGRKENTISRDDAKHRSISRGNVNIPSISRGNVSRNDAKHENVQHTFKIGDIPKLRQAGYGCITPKISRKTYYKTKVIYILNNIFKRTTGDNVSYMEEILSRFVADSDKVIQCDKGWYPLILTIHKEIVKIDPNYQILQIKQKYGGLRFYYVSNSKKHSQIDRIVHFYENESFSICEVTGKSGQLMHKNGVYRTLHHSFHAYGWNYV